MPHDPFDHMEEAWGLDGNPFPSEAVNAPDQPYSPNVFDNELDEFRRKLVRGCIGGSANIGFLWSQGIRADTGFGKTTLMRQIAKEINRDFGAGTLAKAGVQPGKLAPVAAAYSNLDTMDATGLYPVLFNAVVDLAQAPSGELDVLDKARERIARTLGADDGGALDSHIRDTWLRIAGTAGPLRPELTTAFAGGGMQKLREVLSTASVARRVRSGHQYFQFALCILAAAGIDHLYLMIDQLEDLATNKSISSAKRSREIGRIRDMLEGPPYANRVHFIFTFHNEAARVLANYWTQNRLPSFEISPGNTASVVVLRGLKDDEQVRQLLRVYLEDHRDDNSRDSELTPFEPEALGVLKSVSDGRVGVLLNRAHVLIHSAAERGLPRITGEFAQRFFDGAVQDNYDEQATEGETDEPGNIDDLLLGER